MGKIKPSTPPQSGVDNNDETVDLITKALGAQTTHRAWDGPQFDEDALQEWGGKVAERLISSGARGGRPTDPEWTVSRRVPFRPETWEALQQLANQLGGPGRSVAPAHLAATFVEERVAEMDEAIKKMNRTAPPGPT